MKKISIVIILGLITLFGLQQILHRASLKPYRVEILAQDSTTKETLHPSIKIHSKESILGIRFSTADSAIICEWDGIEPTEIDVSSVGYSTQRFEVVSGETSITGLLEKIDP